MTPRLVPTLALLLAAALPAADYANPGTGTASAAPKPAADPTLDAQLRAGKVSATIRYRYEQVDQKGFSDEAQASTVRLAFGYETGLWHGFSAFAQFEGVYGVGQQLYNDQPAGGNPGDYARYPQVLDAESSELNQGWLNWGGILDGVKLNARVGRQEILLTNQRLVGNVAWRQNNQTFDAVSGYVQPLSGVDTLPWLKNLTITGAYWTKVHRITGETHGTGAGGSIGANDGTLDGSSGLVSVGTKFADRGAVTAYAVLLRYQDVGTLSSRTAGIRLEGPYRIDAEYAVPYAVECASQSDYGNNPNSYTANYALAEIGITRKGLGFKAGWNRLEGSTATDGFTTPLATGHAFNGWAEKFLNTPVRGLEGYSLSFGGPAEMLAKGLRFQLIGYRFYSQTGHTHYGDEFDANVEYTLAALDPKLLLGFKLGAFRDDEEAQGANPAYKDTVKTSLYAVWNY